MKIIFHVNDCLYEKISDHDVSLERCKSKSITLEIPATIENGHYKVTEIGEEAFVGSEVKHVTFAPGSYLRFVEPGALYHLSSITLPKSIVFFYPDGDTHLKIEIEGGGNKFYSQLVTKDIYRISPMSPMKIAITQARKFILIRESVTLINSYCFFKHPTLEVISFPASLKRIMPSAIGRCLYLRKVIFCKPSQLKFIGEYAFHNCNLKDIQFPPSLEEIDICAFASNTIESLSFPPDSKLSNIMNEAFVSNAIYEIVFPASLKHIGYRAFRDNSISYITFPSDSELDELDDMPFTFADDPEITCSTRVKKLIEEKMKNGIQIDFDLTD